MIKIIVSGTSDGFYPRYASDGVLDDQVSQYLLDRRRLLSRDTDRLYREGYSFQPLQNLGILYHKLILLYDGFGRDGFVMASLFLPSGDSLSGKDIKEALDSIVKELKTCSVNGMASFELDWSFVKRKADELNQSMVKPTYWHKNPVGGNKSYTALIDVPESLVADYFQYPNPLHSGFASFVQVFLTRTLLDPNAVSDNGDQGYKVLSTNDVDIEDTEYIIVFDRDKGSDENLDFKNETIRKKVLLSSPGDYRLGTVSKYGYRSADVKIKAVDKNSEDGCTVKATLPVLTSKRAKLQLEIVGKDTGKSIQSGTFQISDKYNSKVYCEKTVTSTPIEFLCEDVDKTYVLAVVCDKYRKYETEFTVRDGMDETLTIKLDIMPLWSIHYKESDWMEQELCSNVAEDALKVQIDSSTSRLQKNGFEVKRLETHEDIHKIVICCKKCSVNPPPIPEPGPVPVSKKYYLVLNSESKDYSLFRNYRKKIKSDSDCIENLRGVKCPHLDTIETAIRENKYSSAIKELKELKNVAGNYFDFKEIINKLEKAERIPIVVSKQSGVTYDYENHRLECENFSPTKKHVSINSDKYKYQVANPKWYESPDYSKNTNIVKRTLRPVYKISIVSGIIALATVIIACIFGLNNQDELYRELQGKCNDMLVVCDSLSFNESAKVNSRYVGDSLLNDMESLETELKQFKKEHSDYQNDSVFNLVSERYKEQKSRKDLDEQTYKRCKKYIEEATLENIDGWETRDTGGVLSLSHYDDLNNKCGKRREELQGEQEHRQENEEEKLYSRCKKDNLDACRQYYDKYNKPTNAAYRDTTHLNEVIKMMNEAGQELYDVANDRGKDEQTRLDACKKYLDFADYFSKLQYKNDIRRIQKELSSVSGGQSTLASGEKTTISSWEELREVLEKVDEVALGTTKFLKKYTFSGESDKHSENMRTRASAIINAACDYPEQDWEKKMDHYSSVLEECEKNNGGMEASPFLARLQAALEKDNKKR